MAYRMRHRKADGTTTVTRVDGDIASSCTVDNFARAVGVIVKEGRARWAGMNLHPSKSKTVREQEIGGQLNALRNQYTHTRGWSPKKTMKHVASIPAEHWWTMKYERGPEALRDQKELRRYCTENGFNVSKW